MAEETRKAFGTSESEPGPFLAKIVSHLDPSYMGILEVQLLREVGNDENAEGQLHQVKYMSPFYGVTGAAHIGQSPDDYNNTQKSYGMWMVPPDVGAIVVVIFIQGDPKKGYWIGCVQDDNMNFMVPGYASTKYNNSDAEQRLPVAEYNKKAAEKVQDPTQYLKPVHPFVGYLGSQGLLKDDARGITTSSARREVPSMVFGISTPGPTDKQSDAKTGDIGKAEHEIKGAFVSRLGGSSFVMDDGDDKFLRKKKPSEGPPEYAAVEQGETGIPTIPHNELIRIRTRTGHQILMHNSEDLIYIGNARGTTWIELSSDGKIDIYAEDSISVHTKQDINFNADRDVNIEAGRNVNIKARKTHKTGGGKIQMESVADYNVRVGTSGKITVVAGNFDLNTTGANNFQASKATNIKSGANNNFQAGGKTNIKAGGTNIDGGNINLNCGAAGAAAAAVKFPALKTFDNPDEAKVMSKSIMLRVPSHEPWPHHENINPLNVKPEKTDRETASAVPVDEEHWKKYSTKTDTFEKLGEANKG